MRNLCACAVYSERAPRYRGALANTCMVGVSMSSSNHSDEEEQTDRQIYYVISDYTAVEDSQASLRAFSLEWKGMYS